LEAKSSSSNVTFQSISLVNTDSDGQNKNDPILTAGAKVTTEQPLHPVKKWSHRLENESFKISYLIRITIKLIKVKMDKSKVVLKVKIIRTALAKLMIILATIMTKEMIITHII